MDGELIQQWASEVQASTCNSLGIVGACAICVQNIVAHDLPTASSPPLPEA